jgi:hypothetical protein
MKNIKQIPYEPKNAKEQDAIWNDIRKDIYPDVKYCSECGKKVNTSYQKGLRVVCLACAKELGWL